MRRIFVVATAAVLGLATLSCSSDDKPNEGKGENLVNGSQEVVNKSCEAWKSSRQYWEWSEAFLFGAASGYGIDPHIDTWPFDRSAFDNYMKKYSPATNEADANLLAEAIATGQNLTGFHAVEYLLFREGAPRAITAMTADEAWFCRTAAEDIHLNALRLVAAWGGELSDEQSKVLEEADAEPEDDFGNELKNAGKAGSRWSSATAATRQILSGCQNILDEVAHAKIGAPYTGEDKNYIESPHAYNSVQDFVDNTLSCQYALYGGLGATSAHANSVMAYANKYFATEAKAVEAAMKTALSKVGAMKKPFVIYCNDKSAGDAIEALEAFSESLGSLYDAMGEYTGNTIQEEALVKVNAQFVAATVIPTYAGLASLTESMMKYLDMLK